MIADRVDLHVKIDALLLEFCRQHPRLRLDANLRTSWKELCVDIKACLETSTVGHGDMNSVHGAIGQLERDIAKFLHPFAKKYPQASSALAFDHINGECQAIVALWF
jgi:hypothetical protein